MAGNAEEEEPVPKFSKSHEVTQQVQSSLVQAFFACNISDEVLPMIDWGFLNGTRDTRAMGRCYKHINTRRPRDLKTCIETAERKCMSHPMVAVKVIRLNMAHVDDLMTLNPDLAVVFLLRDPRASVWSRMTVFHQPKSVDKVETAAQRACQRMSEDLASARQIFSRNPARIRFLRYEDLAQRPLHTSRNLYRFLRLPWTKSVALRIQNQTFRKLRQSNFSVSISNKGKKLDAFSVSRKNSSLAAVRWKDDIPVRVLDAVQQQCGKVLTLIGYPTLETMKDVREYDLAKVGRFRFAEDLRFPGGDLGRIFDRSGEP